MIQDELKYRILQTLGFPPTEEQERALEAKAADSAELSGGVSSQESEQLGSLGAAFDALGSVEWQPGEDK